MAATVVLDTTHGKEVNDEYIFTLPGLRIKTAALSAVAAEGGLLAFPKEMLAENKCFVVDPADGGVIELHLPPHDCYAIIDLLAGLTKHNAKYSFVYQQPHGFDFSTVVCLEAKVNGSPHTTPGHGPYAVMISKGLADVLAAPPLNAHNAEGTVAVNGPTGLQQRPTGPMLYKLDNTALRYDDGHWPISVARYVDVLPGVLETWVGYHLLTSIAEHHTPLTKTPVLSRLAVVELRGVRGQNHTFPPRAGQRYGRKTFSMAIVPAPTPNQAGWYHGLSVNELDWQDVDINLNTEIRLALSQANGLPLRFEGAIKFILRIH